MAERFRYRAATAEGEMREGILEAPSRSGALEQLRGRRLIPVTLETAPTETRKARSFLGRRTAVTAWARDVATLLEAGVPLDRILRVTAEHTTHPGLAGVLGEVRRSVQGGTAFSEALARHPGYFPQVMVAMGSAGEASGALDRVMGQVAVHLEEEEELRSQIQSSLLYPLLMSVVATLGVAVLLIFVVPRFSTMLEEVGGQLPLTTRMLVGFSGFLTGWWWLWLILLVAGAYGVHRALRDPSNRERWHALRQRIPWISGLELRYATARFARTLGILLQSGVSIVPSLQIARRAVGNTYLSHRLERAAESVAEGEALSSALSGVLPPLALQMMAVGEESGRLEDLCLRVAGTYDGEVRRTLRTLVAMMEPAMILFFGALVGFVALAMLQAIYSINTNVF